MKQNEMVEHIVIYLINTISQEEAFPLTHVRRQNLAITIYLFLERLVAHTNILMKEEASLESTGIRCALLSIEYLNRAGAVLRAANVGRFLSVAFLVAFKYTEDIPVSNGLWAKICGFELTELNTMEIALCQNMDWCIEVAPETFAKLMRQFSVPPPPVQLPSLSPFVSQFQADSPIVMDALVLA